MSAMFDSLVRAVGPNCLLATPDLHLRRAYGDVSRYIALAEGDLKMTVPSLLKPAYGQEVRLLINASQRQGKTRFGIVRTDDTDPKRREQIRVYPVSESPDSEQMLLIVFADWKEAVDDEEAIEAAPESARQRIIELERALSVTRDSLQQANEELETANEELQSTNEELTTVNEALHINAQEVNTLNEDLDNILSNVGIPFIVVDKELAVTRSSAEARRYFKIQTASTRPHVSVCRLPAGFPRLDDMVVEVLETGKRLENHVIGDLESANVVIVPYDNGDGRLKGAIVLISLTSELTQTQKELQLLLDNVPAGVMVRNKSGEILRVNARSAEILKRPVTELEGLHLSDLNVPEAILREDREVMRSGKPLLNVVHEISRGDGKSIWLRFDRMPFRHPETGESCVYSMTQDVSEIYAAQRALRTSEERFDLAVKGSGVGLWDWDIENGTLFWSDRFKQLMGVDDKTFGGKIDDFTDRLHPDDKDRVKAAIDDHLKRCVPFDVQYRLQRDDESYCWIEARGQALWDESGQPRRFLGSVDDITERRKGEIALKEKTEQMALAERMGGIGHWRVDLANDSVFWSDHVYVIHGENPATFKPDLESGIAFYHPEDRDMVKHAVEAGIAEGEPFDFEARILRASGEERIVHSICRTEQDADGRTMALFGVFSDITERRRYEQERQATLDELSRSNAELSRFSYVCSHDLKEPVRTLANMADLLLDEDAPPGDEEKRDLLRRIRKNAVRLGNMIESLLAFSRIDGQLTIEKVDLNDIVDDVQESLGAAIKGKGVAFEVGDLPVLSGAKVHFRQLFQNLIGNALKFGPNSDVRVAIACEEDGDSWLLRVDDNGPGVPAESREEIFEVFRRLHRIDHVEGAGLGLSICRKILKQYDGTIHCEESDLGGASMVMRLPKENA